MPALPELPQSRKNERPYFVDIPGAKQSVIVVGGVGLRGDDPRFYRVGVASDRLGTGSSARLTQTLRIEKGFSYGAYAAFAREPYPATFAASSQVRSNATSESLQIFQNHLRDYRETFTQSDLDVTVNRRGKGDTRRFETLGKLIGQGTRSLDPEKVTDDPEEIIDELIRSVGTQYDLVRVSKAVLGHWGIGEEIRLIGCTALDDALAPLSAQLHQVIFPAAEPADNADLLRLMAHTLRRLATEQAGSD